MLKPVKSCRSATGLSNNSKVPDANRLLVSETFTLYTLLDAMNELLLCSLIFMGPLKNSLLLSSLTP